MSEAKKIQAVIEEYKQYLDKTKYDVCRSNKGVWFFFEYDSKNDIYECFYRFSTAEELEQIIIGELIESINIALECMAEEIVFANRKKSQIVNVDYISDNYDFNDRINELAVNIEAIKNTIHLVNDVYEAIVVMVEIARKHTKNGNENNK